MNELLRKTYLSFPKLGHVPPGWARGRHTPTIDGYVVITNQKRREDPE